MHSPYVVLISSPRRLSGSSKAGDATIPIPCFKQHVDRKDHSLKGSMGSIHFYCGKRVVGNDRGRNDHCIELVYSELRIPTIFYRVRDFLLELDK